MTKKTYAVLGAAWLLSMVLTALADAFGSPWMVLTGLSLVMIGGFVLASARVRPQRMRQAKPTAQKRGYKYWNLSREISVKWNRE